MYRILSASADTYITNKIIENSRSIDANVGQAGTLDLYKLYNETTFTAESGSIIELSRVLIKFGYESLTSEDVSRPNFTASLILKDVYGGQVVPSNFTIALYPLAKPFDEGRGSDIVSYRDLDTANFLYSSTGVSWSLSGANASGTLNQSNIDYIVSGNIGSGTQGLGSYFTFTRGDEDAKLDISQLVSASVVGLLQNNGYRISFIESQENDSVTRFVKRFGTRHSFNKDLQPKVHVEIPDALNDTSGDPIFGVSQSFHLYNYYAGDLTDFYSGSMPLTTMSLELIASKSIVVSTSSFQNNFNAVITYNSKSVTYFSQSYAVGQVSTGVYSSSFNLDPTSNTDLNDFLAGKNTYNFKGIWKTTDNNTVFNTKFYKFNTLQGYQTNANENNRVVSIAGMEQEYSKQENVRIRVVVQDLDFSQVATKYPTRFKSVIIKDMRWRLKKTYEDKIVIPFSLATKMSTDAEGMYFDLYTQDLDVNEVYELEFLIRNDFSRDKIIRNKGFIFKIVK